MRDKSSNTRLQLTFDTLPNEERIAIRSAIRAVNSIHKANSAEDVNAEAFKNSALKKGGESYLFQHLEEAAKRIGWNEGRQAAELPQQYDRVFLQAATELRAALVTLVQDGRLPKRGDLFSGLAATFMSDVFAGWSVDLTEGGHAHIRMQPRFKSALGLIAYVILKLSEISEFKPAVLICQECEKLKLIESTGGDKISRFCSPKCRNRFGVREFRKRQQTGTASNRAKGGRARKYK